MDYLSGKQSAVGQTGKNDKVQSHQTAKESVFSSFCKTVIGCLNPDEQAAISEKFLTPEIISVLQDKELVDCINAFFKNNLNISETSRNAFLHRNTLLYRIEKISRVTKLNIRNFDDAMTFKFLTIIYDKMNERMGRK